MASNRGGEELIDQILSRIRNTMSSGQNMTRSQLRMTSTTPVIATNVPAEAKRVSFTHNVGSIAIGDENARPATLVSPNTSQRKNTRSSFLGSAVYANGGDPAVQIVSNSNNENIKPLSPCDTNIYQRPSLAVKGNGNIITPQSRQHMMSDKTIIPRVGLEESQWASPNQAVKHTQNELYQDRSGLHETDWKDRARKHLERLGAETQSMREFDRSLNRKGSDTSIVTLSVQQSSNEYKSLSKNVPSLGVALEATPTKDPVDLSPGLPVEASKNATLAVVDEAKSGMKASQVINDDLDVFERALTHKALHLGVQQSNIIEPDLLISFESDDENTRSGGLSALEVRKQQDFTPKAKLSKAEIEKVSKTTGRQTAARQPGTETQQVAGSIAPPIGPKFSERLTQLGIKSVDTVSRTTDVTKSWTSPGSADIGLSTKFQEIPINKPVKQTKSTVKLVGLVQANDKTAASDKKGKMSASQDTISIMDSSPTDCNSVKATKLLTSEPFKSENSISITTDDTNPGTIGVPMSTTVQPSDENISHTASFTGGTISSTTQPTNPQLKQTAKSPNVKDEYLKSNTTVANNSVFPARPKQTMQPSPVKLPVGFVDANNLLYFDRWTRPNEGAEKAARPRQIEIYNLPTTSTLSTVVGLIFGGQVEHIKYKPNTTTATVLLLDHESCYKLHATLKSGIALPGGDHKIWTSLGETADSITGKEQLIIEKGWTRVVRAIGMTDDWGQLTLRRLGRGANGERELEKVVQGTLAGNSTRTVEWHFTSIDDAIIFKHELKTDEDWEHCYVSFGTDPCAEATAPRFFL